MHAGVIGCSATRAPNGASASLIAFITAAGAPAAVMNAINDALAPFGVGVAEQPITPARILRALGRV